MSLVQFKTTDEDEKMIEALKERAGTTTRTKVFRFCLRKTYDLFKDV